MEEVRREKVRDRKLQQGRGEEDKGCKEERGGEDVMKKVRKKKIQKK